jgi:hypothetical protein
MLETRRFSVVTCTLVLLLSGLASSAQAKPPTKPVASTPPKYLVEQVNVEASPQEGALQGKIKAKVRSLVGERIWLPLFTGKVGVLSAKASGGGMLGTNPTVMRREDTVGLLIEGKGRYEVEIEFATAISRQKQTSSALIPMVAALSGIYEITLDGANVDVTLSPQMPFKKKAADGKTVVSILGTAAANLTLGWTLAPEVEMRKVETIAVAEQLTLLHISPGLQRVDSRILFNIVQGRVSQASVVLPAGYALLKVECDDMRTWNVQAQAGGESRLVVDLREPATTDFTLRLALEKNVGAVPVEIEAPQIVVEGVTREKGVLAVAVQKGLQAEILEKKNIGQVDLADMPAELRAPGKGLSVGLRYLARPFQVKLRISTIEPRVHARLACLSVASLERVRQHWDVQYEIRNAGLFQLKLRLPAGMKLISLHGENINNQSLDAESNVLTVDLRSKAEGAYQLSLQTTSEIADAENVVLPALELLGVERQWGIVAVSADSGIAIEANKLTGISQIDLAELSAIQGVQQMIKTQQAAAPALAFRYLSFPYKLELGVSHTRPELKVEPLHLVQITRKNLRYTSVFHYKLKKAGVFQVRLHLPPELRGSLMVKGAKVEDYSYDQPSQTLTVQLTEKVVDELRLEIETEALLGKDLPKPGQSGELVIPAIYALDCEQERGYIAIGTDESIRLKRADEGGPLHDVDVQEISPDLLQRASNAKLAFRIIESKWALTLEARSVPPKVTTETFNYVRFGEDYLIGASTIEFAIQHAGVKEFFVRLPVGVTKPNIRGRNIKIQEKVKEAEEHEAGDLWRIELQAEVKGAYQLIFDYTIELDPKETRREFSGPRVIGEMDEVEREIGYLAVTGDPSLELTADETSLAGLTPVDEEEIPLKFRELPPAVVQQIGRQTVPILFAFRYLTHPYSLVLSSVRHDEAAVVTAVVETCRLDTTLTREGNRITTLIAEVRSRYQPFLEIKLPPKAKLWHALVNGRRVSPLTEQKEGGETTKIPIAQVQGMRGPVKVELQWEELEDSQELGRWQQVKLNVPSLEGVRILRLGWVLQLPRRYQVLGAGGTLERLSSEAQFEESLRRLQPSSARGDAPRPGDAQMSQTLTDQQESNASVLTGRVGSKQPLRRTSGYAGGKPELPQRVYFQGLILDPNSPSTGIAFCLTQPALRLSVALVALATFGLCALLWYRCRLSNLTSFIVLVAVLLVATGLMVLAEGDYTAFFGAFMAPVATAAAVFGLTALSNIVLCKRPAPEAVQSEEQASL